MDLRFKIKKEIEEKGLLEPGDHVLITVSGGVDSMVLADILISLQDDIGFLSSIIHVNHNLRGKESDTDAAFVKKFASARKIPFFLVDWEGCREGDNLQEKARDFRYDSFRKRAALTGANRIALAHNMNDQAETIIFNLIRGSGLDGICGMHQLRRCDEKIEIIRPLLHIERSKIEEYARNNNVVFRKDVTNDQTKYRRNFIRHKIFPLLREVNPNVVEVVSNSAEGLSADESYIQSAVEQLFKELVRRDEKAGVTIDLKTYTSLPYSLRIRLLKRGYSDINGSPAGLMRDHLVKMDKIAGSDKKEGDYDLPNSIRFRRKSSGLAIFRK